MNAYQTAHNGVILVSLESKGRLQLVDQDRMELINRMSTNNLKLLTEGQGMETVLTTPIGRIIDLLTVLHDGDRVIVITGEGRGDRIFSYFRRNIFFMDKVKVTQLNESTRLLGVFGAGASSIMDTLWVGAGSLATFHFLKQGEVFILRVNPLAGGGYWILGEAQAVTDWQQQLSAAGAVLADRETYELLSIEAGIPLPEHELTEDYIPLEAGLWHVVSFNKGCYTGQEIIARMESRGKLAKVLMRFGMDTAVPSGADLFHETNKVGILTSLAAQPDGGYLGLGYVKTTALQVDKLHTTEGVEVKILGVAGTQPERE
jgi:aminomethyltransferase